MSQTTKSCKYFHVIRVARHKRSLSARREIFARGCGVVRRRNAEGGIGSLPFRRHEKDSEGPRMTILRAPVKRANGGNKHTTTTERLIVELLSDPSFDFKRNFELAYKEILK